MRQIQCEVAEHRFSCTLPLGRLSATAELNPGPNAGFCDLIPRGLKVSPDFWSRIPQSNIESKCFGISLGAGEIVIFPGVTGDRRLPSAQVEPAPARSLSPAPRRALVIYLLMLGNHNFCNPGGDLVKLVWWLSHPKFWTIGSITKFT